VGLVFGVESSGARRCQASVLLRQLGFLADRGSADSADDVAIPPADGTSLGTSAGAAAISKWAGIGLGARDLVG